LSTAAEIIRAEIAKCGAISFARFMELALYCPVCGFYEKENDTIGRRGNFYTSVSVGSLFGQLLAMQFAAWLGEIGAPKIVEAGAYDGRLAKDILTWLLLRRPELAARTEYWIIEPSARRQRWQRETLIEFMAQVRWIESIAVQPAMRINGIIFSNEFLDAMPVHRLGWDARRQEWFEWGVALNGDRFVWTRLPQPDHVSRFVVQAPPELLAVLPDGFTTEVCPAAEQWWHAAAAQLERGRLLTFDYGLADEEFFAPHRADGTLRAYHCHRVSDDVLANPGEQDLTAHINIAAIQRSGEVVGLRTEVVTTQAQFLTGIAGRAWKEGSGFGIWTEAHTREFQTLTHPEHLGRAFRVLVQAR